MSEIQCPCTIDGIQETEGVLVTPEIRVWVHSIEGVDDYYEKFYNFQDAERFCENVPGAEKVPLLAINGLEINVYEIRSK